MFRSNNPTPEDATEVESHVQARMGRRVRDLRILRRNNGFVLQGRAPTYYIKQLAQHALMEATSLPVLANEIAVS